MQACRVRIARGGFDPVLGRTDALEILKSNEMNQPTIRWRGGKKPHRTVQPLNDSYYVGFSLYPKKTARPLQAHSGSWGEIP